MATGTGYSELPWVGFHELKRHWGWYVALGICLILLGIFAISFSILATVVSVLVFGWLLLVGGVLEAVHAFWHKKWGGFFVDLFTGILYVVVGFMLVMNPLAGAATLTLLIALFLLIEGGFRIVASLAHRHQHWGWMLLNGVISLVLGVMIWQQWPLAGLWVIGLFVGVEMLLNGWSLLMLGMIASRQPLRTA